MKGKEPLYVCNPCHKVFSRIEYMLLEKSGDDPKCEHCGSIEKFSHLLLSED